MSAQSAVEEGRRQAEALMTDACTVSRATGASTTNATTGQVVDAVAVVYAGRCRVQRRSMVGSQRDAGEAFYQMTAAELQLPVVGPVVRVGDFATVTASSDPGLVGRVFRVAADAGKTHGTSRRFPCTEGGPDE